MRSSLVVVGGPNGSGKTTFALAYRAEHGGSILSADDVADELRSSSEDVSELQAGREFFARFHSALAGNASLILESTLSGRGIMRHLDYARAIGYDTSIVFIFLESADVCVARVAERVRKGGHPVPVADVRRRYPRSITNFWRYHRLAAHRWYLFYNSGSRFTAVGAGTGADVSVIDDTLFGSFLAVVEGVDH